MQHDSRMVFLIIAFTILSLMLVGSVNAQTEPTASFNYAPSDPVSDEKVTLNASTSEASTGNIINYDWTIDYSNSSSKYEISREGKTIDQSWIESGDYTVKLTVTDQANKTDTTSKTITVDSVTPTASFEYSLSDPKVDEEVVLDASESVAPAGEITNYEWSIIDSSDEKTEVVNGEQSSYTWNNSGKYEIKLKITDNNGQTDTTNKTITVDSVTPTASFEYTPSDPKVDEEVVLDASESAAPAGEITNYEWSIIDSSDEEIEVINGEQSSYTWNNSGEYEIKLKITDNNGQTSTTNKTITVENINENEDNETNSTKDTDSIKIDFDNVNDGGTLQIARGTNAQIAGTATNIDSDNKLRLRLSSTDAANNFQIAKDTEVSEDNSFSTTVDLSGAEIGDRFTTSVIIDGEEIHTTDSIIVEPTYPSTDSETDPNTDSKTDSKTDSETDPNTDSKTDSETESNTDTDEPENDDVAYEFTVPGFGVTSAIASLSGIVYILKRRLSNSSANSR